MGLAAGFVHPLTGWDHLLAMVAVGLWAVQLGGRARWALPLTFVSAMILGAAAGIAGPGSRPGVENRHPRLGPDPRPDGRRGGAPAAGAGIALVAMAGAVHGVAQGAEKPLQADSQRFHAAMVQATAGLHARRASAPAGLVAARRRPALVRWAGAGILGAAMVLLLA